MSRIPTTAMVSAFLSILTAIGTAAAESPLVQVLGVGTAERAAVSPDNSLLAVPVLGGVEIYSGPTAQRVGFLPSVNGAVSKVAFSPDGARLAVSVGQVYIWDIDTQTVVMHTPLNEPRTFVAFSADGSRVMAYKTAQDTLLIDVWDSLTARS